MHRTVAPLGQTFALCSFCASAGEKAKQKEQHSYIKPKIYPSNPVFTTYKTFLSIE